MKKTLIWLIGGAVVAMMLMSGMFWLFYTLPIVFFLVAVLYYAGKSTWQRWARRKR